MYVHVCAWSLCMCVQVPLKAKGGPEPFKPELQAVVYVLMSLLGTKCGPSLGAGSVLYPKPSLQDHM